MLALDPADHIVGSSEYKIYFVDLFSIGLVFYLLYEDREQIDKMHFV